MNLAKSLGDRDTSRHPVKRHSTQWHVTARSALWGQRDVVRRAANTIQSRTRGHRSAPAWTSLRDGCPQFAKSRLPDPCSGKEHRRTKTWSRENGSRHVGDIPIIGWWPRISADYGLSRWLRRNKLPVSMRDTSRTLLLQLVSDILCWWLCSPYSKPARMKHNEI